MRVTATKCDGCGTILTGYIRDGWLELQLKRMPELQNRADFCPTCAEKVFDAIREWFPNLNAENKVLALPFEETYAGAWAKEKVLIAKALEPTDDKSDD